jgi:beta-mannosidase
MVIKQRQNLASGWSWRLSNSNGNTIADAIPSLKDWTPATSFPSVIHMELLAQGIIPNPNVGENERLVQWVSDADWEYSCSFETPESVELAAFADLVFEGLDTFATATLNEKEILKSDNMFIPYRKDIKSYLKPIGQDNKLTIVFESALSAGNALEKIFGERKALVRDKRRNHIRKAQVSIPFSFTQPGN